MRGRKPAPARVQFRVNPPARRGDAQKAGGGTISEVVRFAVAHGPAVGDGALDAAPGHAEPAAAPRHGARDAVPEHEERASGLRHAGPDGAPASAVPVVVPVAAPGHGGLAADGVPAAPVVVREPGAPEAPVGVAAHEGLAGQARVDRDRGPARGRCLVLGRFHEMGPAARHWAVPRRAVHPRALPPRAEGRPPGH